VSPLILQAHMFLHVLHYHRTITNLFLVPLNERESQGTAANGCCCTVIDVVISSSPEAESHLALTTQIPTNTVYGKISVQKLQLFRYASPQKLKLCNIDFVASKLCNATDNTLHVTTNSQHVSCTIFVKCNHVGTVVAAPGFQVEATFELSLHCKYHCNEDSNAQSHNTLISRKQTCKIQSKPGLNQFFQCN
jgi:hypothetical protein